jgi:hypothetical protein
MIRRAEIKRRAKGFCYPSVAYKLLTIIGGQCFDVLFKRSQSRDHPCFRRFCARPFLQHKQGELGFEFDNIGDRATMRRANNAIAFPITHTRFLGHNRRILAHVYPVNVYPLWNQPSACLCAAPLVTFLATLMLSVHNAFRPVFVALEVLIDRFMADYQAVFKSAAGSTNTRSEVAPRPLSKRVS